MGLTALAFTNNPLIKVQFEVYQEITLCLVHQDTEKEMNTEIDVVYIDGNLIDTTAFSNLRDRYPKADLFYHLQHDLAPALSKTIQDICHGYNIKPIPDHLTQEEALQHMVNILNTASGSAQTRVISFFGTHSGAGVSTTVMNVAHTLGSMAEQKVLVLSLNPWDKADYFLDYRGKYLDEIRIDLRNKEFTQEKLKLAVHDHGSFSQLAGNRDVKLQRYYQPIEIDNLISVAKETFDVILIDAGAQFDNACYAQSFVSAGLRFLITTQEDKGYRHLYPLIYQQLIAPFNYSKDDFILLINKYERNFSLIKDKELEEELDMRSLTTIPDQSLTGSIAVHQKTLLYDMGEQTYKASIQKISNTIFTRAQLTKDENADINSKKKGVFGGLFKKEEVPV